MVYTVLNFDVSDVMSIHLKIRWISWFEVVGGILGGLMVKCALHLWIKQLKFKAWLGMLCCVLG